MPFGNIIRLDTDIRTALHRGDLAASISDFAIHPTAAIFGEADALLSMTILRIAAEGGCEAIIDQSAPLANARRQEMNDILWIERRTIKAEQAS